MNRPMRREIPRGYHATNFVQWGSQSKIMVYQKLSTKGGKKILLLWFVYMSLKIIKTRTNDNCRVCKINIKISGRSSINIFGEKSKKDDFWNRWSAGYTNKKMCEDSPSCDYDPKKKVCENQAKTLRRRRILQPLHVSNESTATILPFASLPLNVEAVHEPKTSCTEVLKIE